MIGELDKLKKWILATYWDAAQVAGWAKSNFYSRRSHQQTSSGTASGGLPIITATDGKIDATFLDSADLAAQIHAATNKTSIVDSDELAIADSAATYGLKHVLFSVIKSTIATYYNSLAATLTNKTLDSTNISTLTSKTTPIDADSFVAVDSAATDFFKRVTGTNLKAYLKTYLDTLYVALTGAQTVAGVKTFSNGISLGDETLANYDTGSWTPAITSSNADFTTSYTSRAGRYTRIGDRVDYYLQIDIGTISAAGTGDLRISLPIAVANTSTAAGWFNFLNVSGTPINVAFLPITGTSYGNIICNYDAGAAVVQAIGILADTSSLIVQGVYFV